MSQQLEAAMRAVPVRAVSAPALSKAAAVAMPEAVVIQAVMQTEKVPHHQIQPAHQRLTKRRQAVEWMEEEVS
jgi:hypothetical protein